jgi:biotin transport system substrate-specific component
MLFSVIIGSFKGTVSTVVYLVLGICGLPVFSYFTGGMGVLFGLSGGYLFSYPLVALVCGIKPKAQTLLKQTLHSLLMCLISLVICHTLGTLWYMFLSHNTFAVSIKLTAFLFLPFDILKAVLASILGVQIKNALKKSSLI